MIILIIIIILLCSALKRRFIPPPKIRTEEQENVFAEHARTGFKYWFDGPVYSRGQRTKNLLKNVNGLFSTSSSKKHVSAETAPVSKKSKQKVLEKTRAENRQQMAQMVQSPQPITPNKHAASSTTSEAEYTQADTSSTSQKTRKKQKPTTSSDAASKAAPRKPIAKQTKTAAERQSASDAKTQTDMEISPVSEYDAESQLFQDYFLTDQ